MEIVLYTNNSDNRTCNKSLTEIIRKSVRLKENTDISNPVFLVQKFDYSQINYLYCPELGRYYFINSITLRTGGVLEISCHVDVLTTVKNALLSKNAMVRRQENKKNSFLIDNELISQSNTNFYCKTVGTSVLDDYRIYITTCGGI